LADTGSIQQSATGMGLRSDRG